jgi:hypothetical protein
VPEKAVSSVLHHSTVTFFTTKMGEHNCVRQCTRIMPNDEYIYRLDRTNQLSSVNVYLSDAYHFGYADFLGRPDNIRRCDFILIARPEADYDPDLTQEAKLAGIDLGKIGKLLGALNYNNVYEYVAPNQKP